jgi:hypothetical protein
MIPGLVNCYKTDGKITMLLMGKSTMSTGPFSSSQTVNVYQAGYFPAVIHIPSLQKGISNRSGHKGATVRSGAENGLWRWAKKRGLARWIFFEGEMGESWRNTVETMEKDIYNISIYILYYILYILYIYIKIMDYNIL